MKEALKVPIRRYLIPVVTTLAGCVISLTAFSAVRIWDRQEMRHDFEIAAENRYGALKREVDFNLYALLSLHAFIRHEETITTTKVTREGFHSYLEPIITRFKSIQAFEWIPRVPDAERRSYEERGMRGGGRDFQITEFDADGVMTTSASREEYFPVYFVEPYKGNERALGFDLASNPVRREVLEHVRDTGKMSATARIKLVQEKGERFGFLVFVPLYRMGGATDSVAARRESLKGFSLAVFRVGDILEDSLSYLKEEEVDIYLYDHTAPEGENFLYHHTSRTSQKETRQEGIKESSPDSGIEYARTLDVAGREWLFRCRPTPAFIAASNTGRPLGVLVGGLLFTGLLASYLASGIRRTERIEAIITERTHQLYEAQEELVRREKLIILGQLAGGVGNELRNPLGVMTNAVFFLKNTITGADATVREYLDIITIEIRNSNRIISDFFDFFRTHSPNTKSVQSHTLMTECLEKCAVPDNVAIIADVSASLPSLKVDPVQIMQVFQNLIANAVQAMPTGGVLQIVAHLVDNVKETGTFIELSFTDTGEGIVPENMNKIFQPLFSTKSRGIGLGLPITKNLVEANGGRIEVASEQGKQTTFTVVLPVQGGEE